LASVVATTELKFERSFFLLRRARTTNETPQEIPPNEFHMNSSQSHFAQICQKNSWSLTSLNHDEEESRETASGW
jgi:hypothetical protein